MKTVLVVLGISRMEYFMSKTFSSSELSIAILSSGVSFFKVSLNPFRIGPRSREKIREQVDKMTHLDVIEPSSSEWASPIVLVPKPDGSSWFCIDYRQLNEWKVRDACPLTRMDDCLDLLGEANFFFTFDCNVGYWQIPIALEYRHLTTFICHSGTFH